MRFIFLLSGIILYLNPVLPNISTIADTLFYGDTSENISDIDTTEVKTDSSSVKKSMNIILYQLHSLVIEQEYTIKIYRLIILGLILLVSSLITILILRTKSHFYITHFPFFRQKKGYHSGLVCLQMISKYFGKRISYRKFKKISKTQELPDAISLDDIVDMAKNIDLQIGVIKTDIKELMTEAYLPAIIYLPNHMVILYKITDEFIFLADPFYGFLKLKIYYFVSAWYGDSKNQKGIALLIRPSAYSKGNIKRVNKALSIDFSKIKLLDRKQMKEYICEINI